MSKTADTSEYKQGIAAFIRGEPEDSCPFPSRSGKSASRIAWFDGYYDKRTGARLAKAFKFYGVQWP